MIQTQIHCEQTQIYLKCYSLHQLWEIVTILWDSLLDLDDLSASTNSIMELLATLLARDTPTSSGDHILDTPTSGGDHILDTDRLSTLVPRLWPFLAHLITSVRVSCLKTLLTILRYQGSSTDEVKGQESAVGEVKGQDWLSGMLGDMLTQLFQRFLLERDEETRELTHEVWGAVLASSTHHDLSVSFSPLVLPFLSLVISSGSAPLDPAHLTPPTSGGQVRHTHNSYAH